VKHHKKPDRFEEEALESDPFAEETFDIYDKESWEEMLDDDEISSFEESFMRGYSDYNEEE